MGSVIWCSCMRLRWVRSMCISPLMLMVPAYGAAHAMTLSMAGSYSCGGV